MTKFRLFFSHRTSDKERVTELQESLKELLPNLPIEDVATAVPCIDDWKTIASEIIHSCDGLICIVNEDTYMSEPVDWEIREAHRLNKPLVVTTLSEHFKLPSACNELRIEAIPWKATDVAGYIGEMLVSRVLFLKHDWSTGPPQSEIVWQQYNLMVQSWESLIERRQTVNTVYITANSALLAGIGILISSVDKLGFGWAAVGLTVVAFLGVALSFNWRRTILSYGTLSRAKAKVVIALETFMPARLFDAEWRVLEAKRYKSTTATDNQTALFFLLLFVALFLVAFGMAIGQWV
jgi:hypothetical protein